MRTRADVTPGDDDHWPEEDWLNSRPVVYAAGVAALVLAALLIYAVIQVSDGSVEPPQVVFPGTQGETSTTSKSSGLKTPSSTSYTVPSAQTSEPVPAPAPPPSVDAPPADEPTTEETTTTNPYTTTTTDRAGSI